MSLTKRKRTYERAVSVEHKFAELQSAEQRLVHVHKISQPRHGGGKKLMAAALRSRTVSFSPPHSAALQQWKLAFSALNRTLSSSSSTSALDTTNSNKGFLNLEEVEKILTDVRADDVKVFPVHKLCDFTDHIVVATGRSAWHVRNIAQALIYKVKQKQEGVKRKILPSVEGIEAGNWVVVDTGSLIIHALDEKVRAYYNLERLWDKEEPNKEQNQEELEKAFVKVRRKNNSKKPANTNV